MNTSIQKKLTELAREFDLREIRIQTEDRREMFLRFEGGCCMACWNSTMPEDTKAEMEMKWVKSIIDHRVDEGWLLGYHHEYGDGFVYRYCAGLYEERRQQGCEGREIA
ncbi:hypothetical protein [Pararhodobacter aggregans]|uniref:Uncharacterized protein n=1 Tax=Pararhodobacter aggregans TaxID=404875 RepID=A0A2T7UR01_9RHOB|nr:hypothetical protein [Pararhodobacter aggregans]PTX01998.1 hypothetical protein C8N33_106216 [Pararhodobacter aggregans]PVE47180.1 hypothetical protein DDE23_13110 [Pararhodobacter aggregans]